MQHTNATVQKIIRTRPLGTVKVQHAGKQWTRSDKRAAFSQK